MTDRLLRRLTTLALAGGLLGWILTPLAALAQDGEPRTDPPATKSGNVPQVPDSRPGTLVPPVTELLPPVPASENDPAPPGTRAVPPGAVDDQGRPLTPAQAALRARQMQGILSVEGVVIGIEQPQGAEGATSKLPNEKVRLIVDPTQTWDSFVLAGPSNISEDQKGPSATAPPTAADANAEKPAPLVAAAAAAARAAARELKVDDDATTDVPADDPAAGEPADGDPASAIGVLVTARTRVFVHARTKDGIDLMNMATASSPNVRPDGTGVTGRVAEAPPTAMRTNFTNIHVGSFVSIRYRTVDDVNQAVNVNLIELPIIAPGDASELPGEAPIPVRSPGVSGIPTDETVPGGVPATPGGSVPTTLPR